MWKKRDSVQFQTVLAMHEQENCPKSRNCHTMVRRHIDQMNGTCNFKARNERIETGVLVKSQKKRRKVSADRNVGECFQWKTAGQCSRGDSCGFIHASYIEVQKVQTSSRAPTAPTQTDE